METQQNTHRYITHLQVMEKLQDFYGIYLQERIVQEMVYDCLLDLGRITPIRDMTCLDIIDYKIDNDRLPCNLYYIKSITKHSNILYDKLPIGNENYVGQVYGIYVDYIWDNEGIKFNTTNEKVCIEWEGIKIDKDNNILFEEDLLNVCVAYCVYKSDYAKFRSRQIDPAVYQESYRIYQEEFQKARRTRFNRNYLDKAVKTLLSWNANRYFY
jgi:hypothetical protein